MAKGYKKRLTDTNALVMHGGVGLAALEAMFNMVNTQSLLSAGMVRDHDLSHPLRMQALATALAQILAASEYGLCEDAVAVDIPRRRKTPKSPSGGEGEDTELGAVPDLNALNALLNKNKSTGDTRSDMNLSSTTTNTGLDGVQMDKHMTEFMEMMREHLSDIVKSSKPTLAVT